MCGVGRRSGSGSCRQDSLESLERHEKAFGCHPPDGQKDAEQGRDLLWDALYLFLYFLKIFIYFGCSGS